MAIIGNIPYFQTNPVFVARDLFADLQIFKRCWSCWPSLGAPFDTFDTSKHSKMLQDVTTFINIPCWVCLKIGYIPNEIAIFHRDNDQQNQTGFRGLAYFQTHPCWVPCWVPCLGWWWPGSLIGWAETCRWWENTSMRPAMIKHPGLGRRWEWFFTSRHQGMWIQYGCVWK